MIHLEAPLSLAILAAAGLVAASINAFAGGGSLISFPTLMGLGMPSIPANATNSVALWTGNLTSALSFLPYLSKTKSQLRLLLPPTLLGALGGAVLLVATPESAFKVLVPVLILIATLLLAFQKRIKAKVESGTLRTTPLTGALIQFAVSIYGGYFGAGMGIMMLAAMSLFIKGDLHELNALKNWLTVVVNLASTVVFVSKGLVQFLPAAAMMSGALVGGYLGAKLSQKVNVEVLRKCIVAYGFVMTIWFVYSLRK